MEGTTGERRMIYFWGFLVAFVTIGLRGFQHKNVISNRYKMVFFTAYMINAGEIVTIGLVVLKGWEIFPYSGTGAALGMITSMWLHDKLFKS